MKRYLQAVGVSGLVVLATMGACSGPESASEVTASVFDGCPGGTSWCIPAALKQKLAAANAAMPAWEQQEKTGAYWGQSGIQALPLTGTILKVIKRFEDMGTPKNHYGYRRLHFNLRRAAQFTKLAFGDLGTITILRCNTKQPLPENPDPSDAHLNGTAADINYVSKGNGAEPLARIDYGRSFWFTWAAIHAEKWSDGAQVGAKNTYVLTDYSDELRAYARMAKDAGLITAEDLSRFTNPIRDKYRNHENHVHIDVRSW